jgi:hypothetical protein
MVAKGVLSSRRYCFFIPGTRLLIEGSGYEKAVSEVFFLHGKKEYRSFPGVW